MFWRLANNDIIDIKGICFPTGVTKEVMEITTPYYMLDGKIYRTDDNVVIQEVEYLSQLPKSENLFEILPEGSIIIIKDSDNNKKVKIWHEKSGIFNYSKFCKIVNKYNLKQSLKNMDEQYKTGKVKQIYIPIKYAGKQAYVLFK